MINPRTKSHINYILFFVICFLSTATISAIENTNKALEKLLLTQEKIIPSDQAFKLKVKFDGKEIKFSWDIKENCNLYLDKFSFFSRYVGNYHQPSFPNQGCNQAGYCYPPTKKYISISKDLKLTIN